MTEKQEYTAEQKASIELFGYPRNRVGGLDALYLDADGQLTTFPALIERYSSGGRELPKYVDHG